MFETLTSVKISFKNKLLDVVFKTCITCKNAFTEVYFLYHCHILASIERQPATVVIFFVSKFAQRASSEGRWDRRWALCFGPAFQKFPKISC